MDVVALAQAGFENAVATLGTACTAEHVQKLFRFTDSVVFSFDGDAAGRRAALRALEASLPHATDTRTVRFLFLPTEHDPDSFVRAEGAEAFERCIAAAVPLSRQLLEGCRGGLRSRHAPKAAPGSSPRRGPTSSSSRPGCCAARSSMPWPRKRGSPRKSCEQRSRWAGAPGPDRRRQPARCVEADPAPRPRPPARRWHGRLPRGARWRRWRPRSTGPSGSWFSAPICGNSSSPRSSSCSPSSLPPWRLLFMDRPHRARARHAVSVGNRRRTRGRWRHRHAVAAACPDSAIPRHAHRRRGKAGARSHPRPASAWRNPERAGVPRGRF